MANHNYTMDDIGKFIEDYKLSQQLKPKDWMLSLPIVGKKMYEKAYLEEVKREFFEKKYYEMLNASLEEQQDFIKQMAPVLNDFYGETENKSKKR